MDIYMALKAFICAVDSGTITGAAQLLSISQPAVSKHLQNLERHLNARLLDRSSRRVTLTSEGLGLYEASRHALSSIEAALEGVRLSVGEVSGSLRVHSPTSIGFAHLHKLLLQFQQSHAGIEIDLTLDDRQVDMSSGHFDVAVWFGRIASQEIVARRVGWVQCVLASTPHFLEKVGGIDTPGDLEGLSVIVSTDLSGKQRSLRLFGRDGNVIDVNIPISLRTNNSQVVIDTLLTGHGVAAVHYSLVSRHLASGQIVRVLPDYAIESLEMYLTYPSNKYMRPIVRAFSDFVVPRLKLIEGIAPGPD